MNVSAQVEFFAFIVQYTQLDRQGKQENEKIRLPVKNFSNDLTYR